MIKIWDIYVCMVCFAAELHLIMFIIEQNVKFTLLSILSVMTAGTLVSNLDRWQCWILPQYFFFVLHRHALNWSVFIELCAHTKSQTSSNLSLSTFDLYVRLSALNLKKYSTKWTDPKWCECVGWGARVWCVCACWKIRASVCVCVCVCVTKVETLKSQNCRYYCFHADGFIFSCISWIILFSSHFLCFMCQVLFKHSTET